MLQVGLNEEGIARTQLLCEYIGTSHSYNGTSRFTLERDEIEHRTRGIHSYHFALLPA